MDEMYEVTSSEGDLHEGHFVFRKKKMVMVYSQVKEMKTMQDVL